MLVAVEAEVIRTLLEALAAMEAAEQVLVATAETEFLELPIQVVVEVVPVDLVLAATAALVS
jgi:hypothetical protein